MNYGQQEEHKVGRHEVHVIEELGAPFQRDPNYHFDERNMLIYIRVRVDPIHGDVKQIPVRVSDEKHLVGTVVHLDKIYLQRE